MTDEYHGYRQFAFMMKHEVINHQEQYVEGDKHTNTIESFWSLLKKGLVRVPSQLYNWLYTFVCC